MVEEDKGGQERDPGEVVRWRIRFSLPTASVPLPLSNLLTHTQRCLAHIASGNGYAQTVAFCPQMDPPPIPPSPPPTSGWLGATPAAGRGEGIHVCVEGQDWFGIDIRQVGIARRSMPLRSSAEHVAAELGGQHAARGSKSGHNLYFYLTPPPPGSFPSFLPLALPGLPPPFGVGDAHSLLFLSLPRARSLSFKLPLERAGLGSGCSGTKEQEDWTTMKPSPMCPSL